MARGVNVSVKGLNSWNSSWDRKEATVDTYVVQEVKRSGESVTGNAKSLAPVDTGELRNSIDNEYVDEGTVKKSEIYSDVKHAPFQEYGTSHHSAQPYMIPSFNAEIPVFVSNVRRAFKRGLD